MKTLQSRSDRRLARATRGPDPAVLRAAAQRHLDARRQRLEAYEASLAASLRAVLKKNAAGANAARFERQLSQVRKEVLNASRPRLPRLQPASPPAAPPIDDPSRHPLPPSAMPTTAPQS